MLYEPAWPHIVEKEALGRLEELAQAGNWEGLAVIFFRDRLFVPVEELDDCGRRSLGRRLSPMLKYR